MFNREGQLLTFIGDTHANAPGQFKALVGIAIDKQNRVFTTEQYPGRMQMFRYVTDAEAATEKAKRDAELQRAADARKQLSSADAPKADASPKPAEATPKPDAAAPAQKPPDAPTQKPAESTPAKNTASANPPASAIH